MKKIIFVALAAMLTLACGNKGKSADAADGDSLAVDSTVAEAAPDTTPKPMFLYALGNNYMQMVYWTGVKEPQKTKDNAEYFDESHHYWALQEGFRRNAAQYTKMLISSKLVDIKYIGESLKNPDGEEMYGGELHGRESIPSPGLRYAFANDKDKRKDLGGFYIVVTESYLQSRKLLDMKSVNNQRMPKEVVKQLETEYKMKASRSKLVCKTDRYSYGIVQFEGAYRTKKEYGETRQTALALEVLTDGDKVYSYPVEGYYEPKLGPTWNVDDDGEYIPSYITAFEGPNGLECCYEHGAPESLTVGMFYIVNGKMVMEEYEMYHVLIDENVPLWKKDIAQMRKLYEAKDRDNKNYKLTKYRYLYLDNDYDHPQVWMRAADDKHGAIFINTNGKWQLIGTEDERTGVVFRQTRNNVGYLQFGTPAGGPSWYTQMFEISKGRILHRFNVLEVYGEIDECHLDGKALSKEQGRQYIDNLPPTEEPSLYWEDIQE